jgi:DNA helicase IV
LNHHDHIVYKSFSLSIYHANFLRSTVKIVQTHIHNLHPIFSAKDFAAQQDLPSHAKEYIGKAMLPSRVEEVKYLHVESDWGAPVTDLLYDDGELG